MDLKQFHIFLDPYILILKTFMGKFKKAAKSNLNP